MTQAICLNCGADKFGALVPCPVCTFCPEDHLERAKSLVLSEHYLSGKDLEEAAAVIRGGGEPELPEDALAQCLDTLENEIMPPTGEFSKPSRLSGVLSSLSFVLIPFTFLATIFLVMPFGFLLAEKLIGRPNRPPTPWATGVIRDLQLTDQDASNWLGHDVRVFSSYIQFDDPAGNTTLIPREQVRLIVVAPEESSDP